MFRKEEMQRIRMQVCQKMQECGNSLFEFIEGVKDFFAYLIYGDGKILSLDSQKLIVTLDNEWNGKIIMGNKYYAYYQYDNARQVAMFDSEEERNEWVANETNFVRVPLTYDEAVDILACDPAKVQREEDTVNDRVIWLVAPPISEDIYEE